MFNTQAQSLLLMTSVAMPVFSKKKETVGVDFDSQQYQRQTSINHTLLLVVSWDFTGSGGNRCGLERADEISSEIQGKI